MELRKTSLYEKYVQIGARMADFAGWILPLECGSILEEAKAGRKTCGLFDVSHMGEIKIKGKGAFRFLQRLVSNDLSLIKKGRLQYNLFLNQEGGIIDDLIVYNLGEDYLCVVNSSNIDKILTWFKQFKNDEVEIINESRNLSLLALQGPKSQNVIESIWGKTLALKYMHFIEGNIFHKSVLVSRSGYTGEDGFEIYLKNRDACFFWDLIKLKSEDYGLKLCGLGARDILRIEAGYPLYGHEIDETINPFEASLEWAVKLNKDFIGKDKLIKIKTQGLSKKRVGFSMEERGLPRKDYGIYAKAGEKIGRVTSGTYSPNLNKFIGLGYVNIDFSKPDTLIKIKIRNKFYQAKVVNLPFVEVKK